MQHIDHTLRIGLLVASATVCLGSVIGNQALGQIESYHDLDSFVAATKPWFEGDPSKGVVTVVRLSAVRRGSENVAIGIRFFVNRTESFNTFSPDEAAWGDALEWEYAQIDAKDYFDFMTFLEEFRELAAAGEDVRAQWKDTNLILFANNGKGVTRTSRVLAC